MEAQLTGYDTCLYCLGISSAGMSEADYRRITFDFSVAAGEVLTRLNPGMRLCFISGASTDLNSRQMWARVKGEAEQAMMAMPWGAAFMLRPAMIEPKKGVVSGVASYRFFYKWLGWSIPVMRAVMPKQITDTVTLGRALIRVARDGYEKPILENHELDAVGR